MGAVKKYLKEKRSLILLLVLLLAIAGVYGWEFFPRASAAPRNNISPEVVKLIKQQQGKPLVFPFFQPGFKRPDFRHMTQQQREAFHRRMRDRFQAFFLAYAHASPAQRKLMAPPHPFWAHHPHPHHKGHPRPNWQAHMPQMIANGLLGGNPQMHAAAAGFFMSRRNSAQ